MKKQQRKESYCYALNSKLSSRTAELDDINGYIDECNANISTLKERAFMSSANINSEVCASMLQDECFAKLYDLQCKKGKLVHEIEEVKAQIKELQDSLNEELDEALSK